MAKFVSTESVRLMAAVQQLFGDGQLSGLYRLLVFVVMKIHDNIDGEKTKQICIYSDLID
ncbi:hypothetical protein [Bifidobacterium sp. JNUCC 75]